MQRSDTYNKHLLIEDFWLRGYYSALINCRVVDVKVNAQIDDYSEELWPVIVFEDANGEQFECEISRDPEGNGPGFMFGLPQYSVPEHIRKGFDSLDGEDLKIMLKGKFGI